MPESTPVVVPVGSDHSKDTALPDPSALTTQALWREVGHLKQLTFARIDDLNAITNARLDAIEKAIDVAHEDMVRWPTDVDKQVGRLKELHAMQFCENDKRYSERWVAQEKALDIALTTVNRAMDIAIARVDKEFHEHLQQVRTETLTAFTASEKAIAKAESASERRFESVNEFRGQLADQAAMFIPRLESEAKFISIMEKVDALTTRIDRNEGRGAGMSQGWALLVGAVGLIAVLIGIFVALRGQ